MASVREVEKFTAKAGTPGPVIHSPKTDLVEKHGGSKFERLGGGNYRLKVGQHVRTVTREIPDTDPEPLRAGAADAPDAPKVNNDPLTVPVAPHGQVSSGLQVTAGGVTGLDVRGPDPADEAKKEAPGADDHGFTKSELAAMTNSELHDLAAAEEYDLHGAKTKEELIAAVQKGQRAKARKK